MNEDIARLKAEMDQVREGVKEFAVSLWAFYNELRDQGFTEQQAFDLSKTWLIEGLRGADGDSE